MVSIRTLMTQLIHTHRLKRHQAILTPAIPNVEDNDDELNNAFSKITKGLLQASI